MISRPREALGTRSLGLSTIVQLLRNLTGKMLEIVISYFVGSRFKTPNMYNFKQPPIKYVKNKFVSLNFHDRRCQVGPASENLAENLSIRHIHERVF